MLDAQFKAMLDAAKAAAQPTLDTLPLDVGRAAYRAMRFDGEVKFGGEVRELKVDGAAGPIPARLYTPKGAPTVGPGLIFYHGGGFVIGDLETHDGLCRRLCEVSGVRIIAIDYRLAPEAKFPAGHDDAVAAANWVFAHAYEIGFDPAHIAVGGDSAGGNLAASVAISLRDAGKNRIAFQMLLYPVVQFGADTESMNALADGYFLTKKGMDWFSACLFGDGDKTDPRASVLHCPSLTGLPPALVVTAGFDPLKDEGKAYAEKLKAAGVPVEHREYANFIHGFYNMAGVSPAVPPVIDATAQALKAALA
ncbi:alpha/beta hydrolase [Phenylobacterium montanum]|uniref:Alpha/beta hydrolase n=1 Tax=Phenylobacterium montanum TaxID=2823693 RepID=A0A975FZN3_9CAUL|nr:alpha/beta hydrolase [Caulobacter sp. S6]QUD87281.1 alpha/beta hydrolase [Caulobacter sp. S6]